MSTLSKEQLEVVEAARALREVCDPNQVGGWPGYSGFNSDGRFTALIDAVDALRQAEWRAQWLQPQPTEPGSGR